MGSKASTEGENTGEAEKTETVPTPLPRLKNAIALNQITHANDIRFGNGRFVYMDAIGRGGFGIVAMVVDTDTSNPYAMKMERCAVSYKNEVEAYEKLMGVQGVPKFYSTFREQGFTFLQLELVGINLLQFVRAKGRKLRRTEAFKLVPQMIDILEQIHERGLVHADIKPANFAFGLGSECNRLYMLDFGFTSPFLDSDGEHLEATTRPPRGTVLYMSANQHLSISLILLSRSQRSTITVVLNSLKSCNGINQYLTLEVIECTDNSRRDDLESLVYTLMDICKVSLPWRNLQAPTNRCAHHAYFDIKQGGTDGSKICDVPEFKKALMMCRALEYDEKPNYEKFKRVFELNIVQAATVSVKPDLPDQVYRCNLRREEEEVLLKFDINKEVTETAEIAELIELDNSPDAED
ncbi:hypothetical protein B9Z55_026308 [Caenorhabditis nigoni]|uniref:Protein kinase domain-containing protein n=1 Tax=Caenorhabditis nigoni TaxID=1611254 RepID=A0A2G5T2I7_9PELO|nr:hypothetical protein B9Z55_026308 [Caenorhabditis nigoni]